MVSNPRKRLSDQARQKVTKFLTAPPIKFSPSNGHPTKELKRKERVNKSKIRPQKYQMSPKSFLAMTQTAYV
ncbi:MAG: hypothetical protein BAJALOKI3v1_1260001 [Promethearchaeota archaeon]|nr:MAG: hypothetical protein BAJALOKI3v1_1260001 [Candidatus Lokiarchaeota archaeon]